MIHILSNYHRINNYPDKIDCVTLINSNNDNNHMELHSLTHTSLIIKHQYSMKHRSDSNQIVCQFVAGTMISDDICWLYTVQQYSAIIKQSENNRKNQEIILIFGGQNTILESDQTAQVYQGLGIKQSFIKTTVHGKISEASLRTLK